MGFTRLCNGQVITDQYIIKYCNHAEDIGDEDNVRCTKYTRTMAIRKCYKCKIFKCNKKSAKAGVDKYNVTALMDETCEETEIKYFQIAELIDQSDNQFLKDYLDSHRKCIEARNDFNLCQKASRRKLVISMWENYDKILTDKVDS